VIKSIYFKFLSILTLRWRLWKASRAFFKGSAYYLEVRKVAAEKKLIERISPNLRVLHGPFKDLIYSEYGAICSSFGPKILGLYECELFPYWAIFKSRDYDTIIDIGAAEGFYCVGLAQIFPKPIINAYEITAEGQERISSLAQKNDLSTRIQIHGRFDRDELHLYQGKHSLILCDCEGLERDIFREDTVGLLVASDLIIECHDFMDPTISDTLAKLFESTHSIDIVEPVERQLSDFPHFEEKIPSQSQKLLMDEERKHPTCWLICQALSKIR